MREELAPRSLICVFKGLRKPLKSLNALQVTSKVRIRMCVVTILNANGMVGCDKNQDGCYPIYEQEECLSVTFFAFLVRIYVVGVYVMSRKKTAQMPPLEHPSPTLIGG